MGSHFDPSSRPANEELSSRSVTNLQRRLLLKSGVGAAIGALLATEARTKGVQSESAKIGFAEVPPSFSDSVTVPAGYKTQVLYAWGDPTGIDVKPVAFNPDNNAEQQAKQAGMHHDGMHFFPMAERNHGLLVVNHEYTDDGLLHRDGMRDWSANKVAKSQAAHGVSVVEIVQRSTNGAWEIIAPSKFARRITATTPIRIAGPAEGVDDMKTSADPSGHMVRGTLNNCASGHTPWGTFLTCEENWNAYFNGTSSGSSDEKRYGIRKQGWGYRWHEHDPRFNVELHPNEPNRFGWVVEFDPFNPTDTPVKRTALGRFKHESALVTTAKDGHVVVYMGDDERFEYIYKFVSRDKVKPGGYAANRDLLNYGTLYVARLEDSGAGEWVELTFGKNDLVPANGFRSQADVVIRCRQAADLVGATPMDRPEWIAQHPTTGELFVALTNNSERGKPGKPAVNNANPRSDNVFGHILRFHESGNSSRPGFSWSQFVLGGDPDSPDPLRRSKVGVAGFGSPDGLWIDPRGLMWIQTDVSTSALGKGPYAKLGNNQMLVADPATGEVRRFLTGPRGCEITGITMSADMRSMFINIQHPGEPSNERSDPGEPTAISSWPQKGGIDRPRSATIVITREDGGIVGT